LEQFEDQHGPQEERQVRVQDAELADRVLGPELGRQPGSGSVTDGAALLDTRVVPERPEADNERDEASDADERHARRHIDA
jgi:hypothetical protein